MATDPKTLAYRKEHDLCPRDGRPNKPGRKMCEYCLKKAAEKTERHRQKKIKANLCTNCGENPPVGSSRLCETCRSNASEYSHNAHVKRYATRKSEGQCVFCSRQAVPGKNTCQQCADRRASLQKDKRDCNSRSGLCSQCGKNHPAGKGKRCQTCIDKRNDWYKGSPTQAKDKSRREQRRAIVIEHYGGKCVHCGESRPECLAIDHINDGEGNSHRKQINKYGSTFYKWLVDNNFPEGFRVLCHNCNFGRHINGGTLPQAEIDLCADKDKT